MNLTDINEIRALLAKHGFRFTKSLGQNFLCADWVPFETAEAAEIDGETGVLEVGPGVGCLTAEIARRAKRVVSIELDGRLRPVLAETLKDYVNSEIVFADVMKTDLRALCEEKLADCRRVVLCANLPYQITTPALTAFVRAGCFETMTVMIQREVALRVCAREDTPDYGAITVFLQWHTQPELRFDVPADCFLPAPKVTSSVVTLKTRTAPPCPVRDEARMFALVRAAFQQRRKTLCNALSNGLGLERETVLTALRGLGLRETVRGEALSIAQFAALSDALFR